MAQLPPPEEPAAAATDARWFRQPTRREHRIAAALFVTFGLFFGLLFYVEAGWGFRWVILVLGFVSIIHGLGHARAAIRERENSNARE